MATLAELSSIISDNDLVQRVVAALIIKADAISEETPPIASERVAWLNKVWRNVDFEARRTMYSVIANNKDVDLAVILAVSDAVVQTQVDAAVETLITTDADV